MSFSVDLSALARRRYQEAITAGRRDDPWNDESLDFLTEAREEGADQLNYVKWDYVEHCDSDPPEVRALLIEAEHSILRTDAMLLQVARLRGRLLQKGKGND